MATMISVCRMVVRQQPLAALNVSLSQVASSRRQMKVLNRCRLWLAKFLTTRVDETQNKFKAPSVSASLPETSPKVSNY